MKTLFRVFFKSPSVEKYESMYTKYFGPRTLDEINKFFAQTCSMPSKPTIEQAMIMQGYSIMIESVQQ